MGIWKRPVRLGIDYHIEVRRQLLQRALYAPGPHPGRKISEQLVEVFPGGGPRGQPPAPRRQAAAFDAEGPHAGEPSAIRRMEFGTDSGVGGREIGPSAHALAQAMLFHRRHPEQAYRSILGITRLEKNYGKERLESACALALALQPL